MASSNAQNPNGPDPLGVGAPPASTPTTGPRIAGGFDPGYQAPTGLQTSSTRFFPGSPMLKMFPGAKGDKITAYGTVPQDELYTMDDAYRLPYQDPENIPNLQQALIRAGLLDPRKVQLGLWDATSAAAYAKVLTFANSFGGRADDALRIMVDNPTPSGANERQQRSIAFTNPADVKAGYANVSQALTGQEQPTGQFANYYHGLEASQNRNPGEDYTAAPSVQGASEQYLQEHNRQDMLDYGTASRMNAFFDLVRSG